MTDILMIVVVAGAAMKVAIGAALMAGWVLNSQHHRWHENHNCNVVANQNCSLMKKKVFKILEGWQL